MQEYYFGEIEENAITSLFPPISCVWLHYTYCTDRLDHKSLSEVKPTSYCLLLESHCCLSPPPSPLSFLFLYPYSVPVQWSGWSQGHKGWQRTSGGWSQRGKSCTLVPRSEKKRMACFDSKLGILPFIVLCVCVCVCEWVSISMAVCVCACCEWNQRLLVVFGQWVGIYCCVWSERPCVCLLLQLCPKSEGRIELFRRQVGVIEIDVLCMIWTSDYPVCVSVCACVCIHLRLCPKSRNGRVWKKKRNCCFWQICGDLLKLMVVCAPVSTIVCVCVCASVWRHSVGLQ